MILVNVRLIIVTSRIRRTPAEQTIGKNVVFWFNM